MIKDKSAPSLEFVVLFTKTTTREKLQLVLKAGCNKRKFAAISADVVSVITVLFEERRKRNIGRIPVCIF